MKVLTTKILTNPFNVYAFSFIAVLCVFSLKWSSFYDELGVPLLTFLVVTSVVGFLLGQVPIIKRKNVFRPIPISDNNRLIWGLIVVGFILEFIYCRSIPFVTTVIGGFGGYRDFEGIPMFHVVLVNINFFWGIYVFLQYQSNLKVKRLRHYAFFAYIPPILLLNRGAIICLLLAYVFIYLMRVRVLSIKRIIYFVIGILVLLLLFGIAGDARDAQSQADETYILRLGGAKQEFIDSSIPKPFFWGYLYVASPIGNIQHAIDHAKPSVTWDNFIALQMEACCPDFLSKRLLEVFPSDQKYNHEEYLASTIFNAPAVYYLPYIRLGWQGMIWMFCFMILIVFSYVYLISAHSVFFLVGWSSLLSTISLNTFNNMWFFGGLTTIIMVFILVFLEQFKKHLQNAK